MPASACTGYLLCHTMTKNRCQDATIRAILCGMKKVRISYRVTPEAKDLIATLARAMGISETAVVEVVMREKARGLGITLPQPSVTDKEVEQET
jgi:hypothetical protein